MHLQSNPEVKTNFQHRFQVFALTLSSSPKRLALLLSLLDWTLGYLICGLLDRHLPALESVQKIIGLELKLLDSLFLYHLPASQGKEFEYEFVTAFVGV